MTLTGNEVITLQFGHYSNFIGTHWWNCQEAAFEYAPDLPSEVNNDVLFREGQTTNGDVTYTPRLLLVDLKGSLGALPESGGLYTDPTFPAPSASLWPSDKVNVQNQARQPKNEFLQDLEQGEEKAATLPNGLKQSGKAVAKLYHLDDSVKSWSDFLHPHLHPRSINLIKLYQHNDTSLPFETFPQGQALWAKPTFNEEFTDRIRSYLEETDNLQGFQVLLDNYDGFAGLGCAGVQFLRDEYPSKASICLACQPPVTPSQSLNQGSTRLLNQALALSSLAEHASLFVPVSGATEAWRDQGPSVHLPYLTYKAELPYHSSVLVASALDSVSLLYRLRSSADRMADVATWLAEGGRTAAALSVRLPFHLRLGATLLDTLEGWEEGPLTYPLTPLTDLHAGAWRQSLVLRGVSESRLMRAEQMDITSDNPAYSCRTLAQLIKTYLLFDGHSQTHVTSADCPLRTGAPFPLIFHPNITVDGQLDKIPRPQHLGVSQVPVMAGLHSSPSLRSVLESLHKEAKKVNLRTLHYFSDSGLESTELLESLEQILCLSECYSDKQIDF